MKQIWATRRPKVMRVFKATGLRYRINIVSGGEGVYILSGVKEKRQESEINTSVWVFQLLLAGIVSSILKVHSQKTRQLYSTSLKKNEDVGSV